MLKKIPKCSRLHVVFFIAMLVSVFAGAQEGPGTILASYERHFMRSELAAKTGILRDAATDEIAGEFIGELYEFALKFTLENGVLFRDDADMIALVGASAQGTGKAGRAASAETLWKVFGVYRDTYSRVEILKSLQILGKGNPESGRFITGNLGQFLLEQNAAFQTGTVPDYLVLETCISVLGALGDNASFPVLFSAAALDYPRYIRDEIYKVLETFPGDFTPFLVDVIKNNPPAEKLAALRIGALNKNFSETDRGLLAETALEEGMKPDSGETGVSLRYEAIEVLTRLKWTRASPLASRHFYQVQTDFNSGSAPRERFLEAIVCLGAMGDSASAQALALQLGYANSRAESGGEYDEAVILALVRALGEIGDKSAFDYLLYISYLSYPEQIQIAAREALNRLKW